MFDPDQLNSRLIKAADEGDLKAFRQALKDGANDRAINTTALWRAASYGHVDCVRVLISLSDPLEDAFLCVAVRRCEGTF